MEILTALQSTGIFQVAVILGIVGMMSRMRAMFLDKVLSNMQYSWLKWLTLTGVAFVTSIVLSMVFLITNFNILEWIKISFFNYIFSYVFYDAIKNLIDKENKL